MEDQYVDITKIDASNRVREVYTNIEELSESIKVNGLIQPLVVNSQLRLIAGGRRLKACQLAGLKEVKVTFLEFMSESQLRILELEENIQREAMTWQEECLAVYAIQNLKGLQMRETASLIKRALGSTQNMIFAAKEIRKGNKIFKEATSLGEAITLFKQQKLDQAVSLMASRTKATISATAATPAPANTFQLGTLLAFPKRSEDGDDTPADLQIDSPEQIVIPDVVEHVEIPLSTMILSGDCRDHMAAMPDASFDHIITDPPYAIDMVNLEQQGKSMADIDRIKETHQVEANKQLLTDCFPHFARITRPNSFVLLWADEELRPFLCDLAELHGFAVQRWSLIWVKQHSCLNMMADYNFTKRTEICLVFRKKGAKLRKAQPTNVIEAANDMVMKKQYDHPFVKPAKAWKFLYDAVAYPGQRVYDPFGGVGSSLEPALQSQLIPTLSEYDQNHYNNLLVRAKELYEGIYGSKCRFV